MKFCGFVCLFVFFWTNMYDYGWNKRLICKDKSTSFGWLAKITWQKRYYRPLFIWVLFFQGTVACLSITATMGHDSKKQNHRKAEVERKPCKSSGRAIRVTQSRLPRIISWLMHICKDEDSTASLGSVWQTSVTIKVERLMPDKMVSALWLHSQTTTQPCWPLVHRKRVIYDQEVLQFEILIFVPLERIMNFPVDNSSHIHNLKSTKCKLSWVSSLHF